MLETRKGSVADLLEELLVEVEFISGHLYQANWQHEQFSRLKNSRPFANHLRIMVLDFAENFSCLYQHEVKSAHWHHEQVTLHPVYTYYKCPNCEDCLTESIICVSDDNRHDYHAVLTFVKRTMDHLQQVRNLQVSHVVQWSDGCGSQYKSKGPFADVAASELDFGLQFHRSYFGSRHGKGPCDGEAAVIKNHVTNAVKADTAVVSNATEFFNYCEQSTLNKQPATDGSCKHFVRSFLWVPEGDVDRQRPHRNMKTVKGKRDIHHVKSAGTGGTLVTRHLACYCDSCLFGTGDCISTDVVGPWKEHSLVPCETPVTSIDSNTPPAVLQSSQPLSSAPPQSSQPLSSALC